MSFSLQIEFVEAYELLISLYTCAHLKDQKTLDVGPGWGKRVGAELGEAFTTDLHRAEYSRFAWALEVLAWRCPAGRDAGGFLRWLDGLSPGEIYELLMPYGAERMSASPLDLKALRERGVDLLHRWHEGYFRTLDPAILAGLAADADRKRALAAEMPPDDVVETATCGIVLEPDPGRHLVVLVPQYHYRPWNVGSNLQGVKLIFYAADALPAAPGDPPIALLRLARALGDESRLRILHHLAGGGCYTFTDLLRHTGLAKSTVHQHMVMLRASGLVRAHEAPDGSTAYSLRTDGLDSLDGRLRTFLAAGHGRSRVEEGKGRE